ncbi:mannosyl-oligosaccharide glucosidase [Dermatophagoides farinae]|uniref:mannosyl-oligosaccharide glucosidase n=1 Tax=Dermatophagoides farinae TaxID=6954 RepID=UPI003F5E0AF7
MMMMQSTNKRQRKSKNQPPPPKILEKLKRNHHHQSHHESLPSSSSFFYTKNSLFFHLIIFILSICIGFFGFSFFIINPNTRQSTFIPFDSNQTFPVYDIFPSSYSNNPYWSSLIPGHYFALRSSRPNSTLVSLMWFRQKLSQNDGGLPIRHLCRQDDKLNTYYWNYNDLHSFGHQTLIDNNLHINTSFIRLNDAIVSRITIIDAFRTKELNSIILYVAAENSNDDNLTLFQDDHNRIWIKVQSIQSENYHLNFRINKGDQILQSFLTTNSSLDRLEQTVKSHLFFYKHDGHTLFVISNSEQENTMYRSNFIAYQVIFNQSIEIDISMFFNDTTESLMSIDDFDYDNEMNKHQQKFQVDFNQKFHFGHQISAEKIHFARTILSNAIGSIGYYYGYSLVDSEQFPIAQPYGPIQLLAVAPSRSVFPRGFLWDEGFQQLLISRWDPKLSMAIIKSWFSLMNENGWIPREVILGDEAISRVPNEYLVQHSSNANPPSLLLSIESLIDRQQFDREWLKEIYPRLFRWYQWFNTTQTGSQKFPFTFRWRGRNSTTKLELNPKTLASGLDDYPRATHPNDDEIHIDLRCWMALASRLMSKISKVLEIDDKFEEYYRILSDNNLLEQLHWSDKYQMFCDKGLHSTNISLKKIHSGNNDDDRSSWVFERQVLTPPHYECVDEFGYISLFPFIMTLLRPDNSKLETILTNIENPEILWTPYGLRSLSQKSSYYKKYNTEHDPPYWRGSIWINMNYLVLKALNHYSKISGPYQTQARQIHSRLKANLVQAIHTEFIRTGYVWEQYQDDNGHGRGAHPFTGWTSLIVLIMADD